MGIFDWLKGKEKDPRANHTFSDEDREIARLNRLAKMELSRKKLELERERLELMNELESRKLEYELERIKAKTDELRGEDDDEEDESEPSGGGFEDQMLAMLMAKVMGGMHQAPAQPVPMPAAPQPDVSDSEILGYWNSLDPRIQKVVKGMSDDQIAAELVKRSPSITKEATDRAIRIIRST